MSNITSHEVERQRQLQEGRKTLGLSRPSNRTPQKKGAPRPKRDKPPLNGHEAFLNAMKRDEAIVAVRTMNGAVYLGVVTDSDKYSITLRHADDGRSVFFKHAIEGMSPADEASLMEWRTARGE